MTKKRERRPWLPFKPRQVLQKPPGLMSELAFLTVTHNGSKCTTEPGPAGSHRFCMSSSLHPYKERGAERHRVSWRVSSLPSMAPWLNSSAHLIPPGPLGFARDLLTGGSEPEPWCGHNGSSVWGIFGFLRLLCWIKIQPEEEGLWQIPRSVMLTSVASLDS